MEVDYTKMVKTQISIFVMFWSLVFIFLFNNNNSNKKNAYIDARKSQILLWKRRNLATGTGLLCRESRVFEFSSSSIYKADLQALALL